jgi:DNA-binding IclR family transcriptional regulator
LDGNHSATELAPRLGMPVIEVIYQLGELRRGGYVEPSPDAQGTDLYDVTSPALRETLARLLAHAARAR